MRKEQRVRELSPQKSYLEDLGFYEDAEGRIFGTKKYPPEFNPFTGQMIFEIKTVDEGQE